MRTLRVEELKRLCTPLLLIISLVYPVPPATRAQDSSPQGVRSRRVSEQPPMRNETTAQTDEEVLEVETNLVNLLFTAVDRDKRFVTDIKREDVRVLEDGKSQELSIFERQTDLPLALAILVDTSASQEVTFSTEKIAATRFLESIVQPEKDEVAINSFAGMAVLEQAMTNDLRQARQAISNIKIVLPPDEVEGVPAAIDSTQPPISSTAIWDAIVATCDDLVPQLVQRGRPQLRRALILLSDGPPHLRAQ